MNPTDPAGAEAPVTGNGPAAGGAAPGHAVSAADAPAGASAAGPKTAAAKKPIAGASLAPRPSPLAPTPASVAAKLFTHAPTFDFFQAVRLLEKLFPDSMPVGFDGPAGRETVRFRSHVSLIFPPSQIWELRPSDDDRPVPEMSVAFFGLVGPSGVMPRHYTEMLLRIQRDVKHDEKFALRDWFDLFTHRMLSLFYRAWEKYRFYISYERGEYLQHPPDPFTHSLLSLSGLGLGTLRNRIRITFSTAESETSGPTAHPTQRGIDRGAGTERHSRHRTERRTLAEVDDLALLRFSGHWVRRPRTAAGLAALLSDYFELPVEVRQFHGQWLQLDPTDQSQLGAIGGNCRLGVNLVIGERVWDVEGKIRIRVGPLNYDEFVEFLPYRGAVSQSKAFFLLSHLARLYIGPTLVFDVQLLLHGETAPDSGLSDPASPGLRLGWNTWLRSGKLKGRVKDAVFEGQEVFDLTGSRQD